MDAFTPWSATLGGVLIGLAASLLFLANGRIAGISGVLGGLLRPVRGDIAWRAAFIVGLVLAGGLAAAFAPSQIGASSRATPLHLLAGLLVGAGTRLGNGCTSGHGVCGISRGSLRSLAATGVFMTTGALTVVAVRLLGGST